MTEKDFPAKGMRYRESVSLTVDVRKTKRVAVGAAVWTALMVVPEFPPRSPLNDPIALLEQGRRIE